MYILILLYSPGGWKAAQQVVGVLKQEPETDIEAQGNGVNSETSSDL
jgi:hypothetical protein